MLLVEYKLYLANVYDLAGFAVMEDRKFAEIVNVLSGKKAPVVIWLDSDRSLVFVNGRQLLTELKTTYIEQKHLPGLRLVKQIDDGNVFSYLESILKEKKSAKYD